MRSTERQRRAVESQDQRETRLTRNRLSQQQRLEAESPEERETRLAQDRLSQQQRLEAETAEERDTRLAQARLSQQQRLEAETPEERAARLQDLRARKQERTASETAEETAARRQRHWEAHSRRPPPASAQPLLHQPAVKARMRKFHSQLASLEVSTCTTCLERFPGMTIRQTAAGTVCIRCHRDTHTPKAYSRENNMHPGPVPMELNQDEVRESVIHMSYVCNVQPHVYIPQIRPTEGTATTHAHSHVRVSHFYAYTSTTSWVAPARHKCSAFS